MSKAVESTKAQVVAELHEHLCAGTTPHTVQRRILKVPLKDDTMIDHIRHDINVASGRIPAEILLLNGRFFDVFTGELFSGDMAIRDGCIVAIGPAGSYRGQQECDLENKIVVPGLIDSHVHIESSLLGPQGFAELTVPHGTTTIIADPHEIANVRGMAGIRWMLDASEHVPQSVFIMLPSCVPATPYEDAGAVLDADSLAELMDHPRVLGLGEVMDYPALAAAKQDMLEKIALAQRAGKRIDGHSPGVNGNELRAYAVAGIGTDHECSSLQEMKERLRLGMRVLIREGTACRDLKTLIDGVHPSVARRCAFCTDDKLPPDIIGEGHIDFNIRSAIACGLDAAETVRLATLNAAEAYGLDDRGALTPGRRADLVVLEGSLDEFKVADVYRSGELSASNGRIIHSSPTADDRSVRNTVNIKPMGKHNLQLQLTGSRARVIGIKPGGVLTDCLIEEVPQDASGRFSASGDFLKLAVVERHKGSGLIGLGIVKGYGLQGGAVASSIAHDSHNLIAIGDDDEAILSALGTLCDAGGGISIAAAGGAVLGILPLPLGGLMSDQSGQSVSNQLASLIETARGKLGVSKDIDPFMTLSFLALPVIPDLKLTARGLFDVKAFDFVDVSPGSP